jgi:uncharacterized membrane protein
MKITDWIQAIAAVLAAIAAWGAWLHSRRSAKQVEALRVEVSGVAVKVSQIESHVLVHHSPVFNMGDTHHVSSPSIVAGTSINAGGDIVAASERRK